MRPITSKSPATRRKGSSRRAHVIFLENLFDELRPKVPGGQITSCCQWRQEFPITITALFCEGLAGYSFGAGAVAVKPLRSLQRRLRQAGGDWQLPKCGLNRI